MDSDRGRDVTAVRYSRDYVEIGGEEEGAEMVVLVG